MEKRSFTDITVSRAGEIANNINKSSSTRKRQGNADPKEIATRKAAMQTQGRKGCKANKICISISPLNLDFVRVVSQTTGRTVTGLINDILDEYRQQHPDAFMQARAIMDALAEPISTTAPPAGKVRNRAGALIDYAKALEQMDDKLRQELAETMGKCSKQKFFTAYEKAHRDKYGEAWELSKENPTWQE